MMKIYSFIFLFMSVIFSESMLAFDSISVLPSGILCPSFQYGEMSGLDAKFSSSGHLLMMEDMQSVKLDVKELKAIEPQITTLVNALNSFGTSRLGDQIHLGYLIPHVLPSVKYFAPILAGGVTENWTIGLGVPVITYSNELSFSHEGSNIEDIHSQVRGVNPQIDDAFSRLNVDVIAGAQKHLSDLGYKPIEKRRETILGDIRLVSLYQLGKNQNGGALFKSTLFLPTGPKDDPNDLADIPIFGQTALMNELVGNYFISSYLTVSAKLGIKNVLPDKISKRVPVDQNDELPGQDRLDTVNRNIGNTKLAGVGAEFSFHKALKFSTSFEYSNKTRDKYSGDLEGDYDLLSADSNSIENRVFYGFEYTTVDSYFAGTSVVPMIFSVEYSDLFSGVNVIRQTQTEITATMFF